MSNYVSENGKPILTRIDDNPRIDVPDVIPNANQQHISFNKVTRDNSGIVNMVVDGKAIMTENDILTQHHKNVNFYQADKIDDLYTNVLINDDPIVTKNVLESVLQMICPLLTLVNRLVYTETSRLKFCNGQRLAISTYNTAFEMGKDKLFLVYNKDENWFDMPDYRWLATRFSDSTGGGGKFSLCGW